MQPPSHLRKGQKVHKGSRNLKRKETKSTTVPLIDDLKSNNIHSDVMLFVVQKEYICMCVCVLAHV